VDSGYGESQVLWGVNIEVRDGEVTLLLGSNGAGKTTTLRTIMGILRAWKGRILFFGRDIDGAPTYKRSEMGIIMVPEGRRLWPYMTVQEHLELGAFSRRAKDKFGDNLELVFELFPILRERSDQLAGTLSGGEQQMLAIARAITADPKILLLDEPSLGLAPAVVIQVFETISHLKEKGITILLVEQNVHMGLSVADYAYVLENGRIVLEGSKGEVERSDLIKKSYLGI
jgi:branched-chain amino acid transport system ATP-binding protein